MKTVLTVTQFPATVRVSQAGEAGSATSPVSKATMANIAPKSASVRPGRPVTIFLGDASAPKAIQGICAWRLNIFHSFTVETRKFF